MGELSSYKKKRDFSKTPEPGPKRAKATKKLRFVVQKHDASRLHYDTRLEVGGVMKSWAVPKGPSLDPADKRLAVMTEDHPIAYNRFEGNIPEGEYGAGSVIVWDRGWYENDSEVSPARAIQKGAFSFILHGKKLQGRYTLRRMNGKNWLLIKGKDQHVKRGVDITAEQPASVVTGRTVEQVAAAG